MSKETMRKAWTRAASTVILARQGLSGLEIYLLRRSSESKFFPGKYVFPGGAVDPEDTDADFWRNRVDLKPLQISEKMGGDLSVEDALGHGVAAIRETFEEAGVLLVEEIGEKERRNREDVRAAKPREDVQLVAQGMGDFWGMDPLSFKLDALVSLGHSRSNEASF